MVEKLREMEEFKKEEGVSSVDWCHHCPGGSLKRAIDLTFSWLLMNERGEGAETVGSSLSQELLTFSGEEERLHKLEEKTGHGKSWWF